MLDLMEEAPGGEPLPLQQEPVSVPVLGADLGVVGPGHHAPLPRHAETALRPGLLAGLLQNFRIHQLQDIVLTAVNDNGPAEDAHLRRGQTGPLSLCQSIPHVIQQDVEAPVEIRHRTALLIQERVTLGNDLANSHSYYILLFAGSNTRF